MATIMAQRGEKMACPNPNPSNPDSLSEHDVDSICGMLMQLNTEMSDRNGRNDRKSSSLLHINQREKSEACGENQLLSIIFGDKNVQDKESDIKGVLESGDQDQKDRLVNFRDAADRTPLMYAVAESAPPLIHQILKCDRIDFLARDRSGNTILMYASVRGYDSLIRAFLNEFKRKYHKDSATLLDYLDAENEDGDTAFTLALKNCHEDCVIVLSEYLKDALEKEERRVTSLAYRMGLRGKSESRMPSMISLKDDIVKSDPTEVVSTDTSTSHSHKRGRSSSPKKQKPEHKLMMRMARRTKDVSKYYAVDTDHAFDTDAACGSKGSPEIRRSSPVSHQTVGVKINSDHRHRSKFGSDKSKYHTRRIVLCEKHSPAEDEQILCDEDELGPAGSE